MSTTQPSTSTATASTATASTATEAPGFAVFARYTGETPNYEGILGIAAKMVPFGVFAGVRITEISPDRGTVEIPADENLTNHMGTVHAGALFLAAEIAGAAAFAGALAPRLADMKVFVLRNAHSTYLKPAVGRIRAVADVDLRTVNAVLSRTTEERFDLDGKALLYDDNDVLVAKFNFDYACHVLTS